MPDTISGLVFALGLGELRVQPLDGGVAQVPERDRACTEAYARDAVLHLEDAQQLNPIDDPLGDEILPELLHQRGRASGPHSVARNRQRHVTASETAITRSS